MSKNCGNCNYENEEQSNFCQACGTPLTQPAAGDASQTVPVPPPVPQSAIPPVPPAPPTDVQSVPPVQSTQPKDAEQPTTVSQHTSPQHKNEGPQLNMDESKQPVSVSTFFIMMLLFSIPFVNIIMMLIWAIGSKNKSKQNFAIAALIWSVLAIILCVVGTMAMVFLLSLSATMMGGAEQDMLDFMQKIFNNL